MTAKDIARSKANTIMINLLLTKFINGDTEKMKWFEKRLKDEIDRSYKDTAKSEVLQEFSDQVNALLNIKEFQDNLKKDPHTQKILKE